MSIEETNEKRFESDIEAFLLSPAGGYTKNLSTYEPDLGLYTETLMDFVKDTQPKAWKRFALQNTGNIERKFAQAFHLACDTYGLVHVLRHGFKHRGTEFKVCYFRPVSGLNETTAALYERNVITCNRQWQFSQEYALSVDMVLAVNGIPVFAWELKNQYTGQTVENAKRQWMYDRDPHFHVYSMRQAIEEEFILDVLKNYMSYDTCFRIAKSVEDNPELPESRATKIIRKYQKLHPYNITQKAQMIVETFRETTAKAIGGKGKMMVVTDSRLAAVRYIKAIRDYIKRQNYTELMVLVAFSGSITDGGEEYTEPTLNTRENGSHISESQLKAEFHENGNILVVAEKYQTGFDEPLLHTMIVDKKLKGVKAVQTLSRLNRIFDGKTDTFILDFANTEEEILAAFQSFYQETSLSQEVSVDLIYKTQQELRAYNLYSEEDIAAFIGEWTKAGGQDERALGRMTSVLKPVADRYNEKDSEERYQFRRQVRSFTRWYSYITQIVRMFDRGMQAEYRFLYCLLKLLPVEEKEPIDLDGKLKLEYYKLKKTFAGAIVLEKKNVPYEAATQKGVSGKQSRNILDEILKRINERFKGEFTDGDKVVVEAIHDRLVKDENLRDSARTSEAIIFTESIFPAAFDTAAMDSYIEQQESYQSIFDDKSKYEALMHALAGVIYQEMRQQV